MPKLSAELRDEMIQHLSALPDPRGGIVRWWEQGVSIDEIATRMNTESDNVANHLRHHRRMLDGQLANSASSAVKEGRIYRGLLGRPLSPALHGYVVSCLQQLQQLAPTISIDPGRLGPMRDASSLTGRPSDTTPGAPHGGGSWSQSENEVTVSSYLSMLKRELAGEAYNKTEERRRLMAELGGSRNEGAIEFKHQNISAVLRENGWAYINGYQPATNIQGSLRHEVERQLRDDQELDHLMRNSGEAAATPHADAGFLADMAQVDPPGALVSAAEWNPRGIKRDYLYQDARNRELGLRGERAVVAMEKKRLADIGRPDLSAKVDHVAVNVGDGLGFDVHSFEVDGSDRLIEVKTTVYAVDTPFFISRNEVDASEHYGNRFHLYRLFKFGSKSCGWYQLSGPIAERCDLQAQAYIARPLPK